ncbi:hypothetical protein [Bradyrhizobium sp. SZCCHNR1039]|uniref:hypothetical protein n=1 Tax=Bradyrhizobium sp. SZCCHNR1039 TaxID=3057350 RepID=UPI00291693D4|nr:hypothetical protein [Bradyrhizobium sp. SZCCHNR1039]
MMQRDPNESTRTAIRAAAAARNLSLTPEVEATLISRLQGAAIWGSEPRVLDRDGLECELSDLVALYATKTDSAASEPNPSKPTGNLTERMRAELSRSRKQAFPDDWHSIRSKVTGMTATMMDEIARTRQGRQL